MPLGYDARGNLSNSGSASYSYGPENLLAATNGGLSFYYDGVGRLVEYTSSVSTRFFYDGNQMAAEVANPGGGILRRYVWGAGVDEALVWYEGSGTGDKRDDGRPVPRTGLGSMGCFPPSSLHADERGSVIAVSDTSGAVTNINTYDEYGIPGAGNVGRFQYTGQAWLPELGMYYYKARIYSPTLGRFLQTDPIGYGDGLNWYNYVGGDPVNATDPSGLCAKNEIEIDGECVSGVDVFGRSEKEVSVKGAGSVGGGRFWSGGSPRNGVGNDPVDVTVTAPQSGNCTQSNRGGCQEKQLPKCAQDFLRGRIAGDPANIRFRRGGSIFNVFGYSVTYGSTIHLTGSSFFRTDAGALTHKFHEIAHTSQNARLGLSALHHGAGYAAFGGHDASPLEQSADDFAQATFDAYQKAGLDKTCPF